MHIRVWVEYNQPLRGGAEDWSPELLFNLVISFLTFEKSDAGGAARAAPGPRARARRQTAREARAWARAQPPPPPPSSFPRRPGATWEGVPDRWSLVAPAPTEIPAGGRRELYEGLVYEHGGRWWFDEDPNTIEKNLAAAFELAMKELGDAFAGIALRSDDGWGGYDGDDAEMSLRMAYKAYAVRSPPVPPPPPLFARRCVSDARVARSSILTATGGVGLIK